MAQDVGSKRNVVIHPDSPSIPSSAPSNLSNPQPSLTSDFSNSAVNAKGHVASFNTLTNLNIDVKNINLIPRSPGPRSPRPLTRTFEIAKWLAPSSNRLTIRGEAYGKIVDGTLRSFLEGDQYLSWVYGATKNLQCVGKPGTGKTTLVSAIIEDLENKLKTTTDSYAILYTFFQQNRQSIQDRTTVLADFLSQLVKKQGDPPSAALIGLYQDYYLSGSQRLPWETIMKFLLHYIKMYKKIYIILDALDEFSLADRREIRLLLNDLKGLKVKMLVTSRLDSDIHVEFADGTYHRIDIEATTDDIRKLMQHQMKEYLHGGHVLLSPSQSGLRDEVIGTVIRKSHGMFLVPCFFMDWISRSFNGPQDLTSTGKIRKALKDFPHSGLDGMYKVTMERIWKQGENYANIAEEALSWVSLAKRRLTVDELQHVIAFVLRKHNFTERIPEESDLPHRDDIRSACQGLLSLPELKDKVENDSVGESQIDKKPAVDGRQKRVDQKVQLLHVSVQEYLMRSHWSGATLQKIRCKLATACLRYLIAVARYAPPPARVTPHPNPEHRSLYYSNEERDHFKQIPFHDYAMFNWVHHAMDIDDDKDEQHQELVFQFLQYPWSLCVNKSWEVAIDPKPNTAPRNQQLLFFARHGLSFLLEKHLGNRKGSPSQGTGINPGVNVNVDINTQDAKGRTAAHISVLNGHAKATRVLLQRGADPNIEDHLGGDTLLHSAVGLFPAKEVEALFIHHEFNPVNLDKRNKSGRTPLFLAVKDRNADVVENLLKRGADGKIGNIHGRTPLILATSRADWGIARILLQYMNIHDVDRPDDRRRAPISYAISPTPAVRAAPPVTENPTSSDDPTAVIIIRILLEMGVDIYRVDAEGRTPLQLARRSDRLEVRDLIEKYAQAIGSVHHLASGVRSNWDSSK